MRFFNATFLSFPWWQSHTGVPIIIKGMPSKFNFGPLTGCGSSQEILWFGANLYEKEQIRLTTCDRRLCYWSLLFGLRKKSTCTQRNSLYALARLIIRWNRIRLYTSLRQCCWIINECIQIYFMDYVSNKKYTFPFFFFLPLLVELWHKKFAFNICGQVLFFRLSDL